MIIRCGWTRCQNSSTTPPTIWILTRRLCQSTFRRLLTWYITWPLHFHYHGVQDQHVPIQVNSLHIHVRSVKHDFNIWRGGHSGCCECRKMTIMRLCQARILLSCELHSVTIHQSTTLIIGQAASRRSLKSWWPKVLILIITVFSFYRYPLTYFEHFCLHSSPEYLH